MIARWRRAACLLAVLGILLPAPAAHAQEWTAGISAGQTVFDPVSSRIGTNHLTGTLRYDARREAWVYGSAAAPLRSDDPVWGVAGSGGRVTLVSSRRGGASLGVDLGGHGYLFRDPVLDQTGTGGTIEVLPVVRLATGATALELRGGWRGHALAYAGVTERRGVVEGGARVTHGRTVRISADTRVVGAPEGSFPYVGGTLAYSRPAFQAWAHAGRWMHDTLDDVAWNAGAGYAVSRRVSLWTSVRQDGRDPLYWNATRRSWTVGLTTTFGRGAYALPSPARLDEGYVTIRVPVAEAPGPALWVAGSFNDWQPAPMTRDGRAWVLRVPLAPGVYRYAFRSADGTWFVPPSIEGRRDDGMGGHVAVLVVDR